MKTLTAWVAAILLGGCAAAPKEDGGIVGTGNRIDCEQARKDRVPAPRECERPKTP
jgi:hypothetical protein